MFARSDRTIDIALLVHVAGAMVLVGGLVTAAATAIIGWSDEAGALRRFSYRTLLAVAFPGYIVMRIGAQWVHSKEHLDKLQTTDAGSASATSRPTAAALLLLIALILGGIGLRQSRNGGGGGLLKASSVIATLLVAVYVVTVWAMGAKPA